MGYGCDYKLFIRALVFAQHLERGRENKRETDRQKKGERERNREPYTACKCYCTNYCTCYSLLKWVYLQSEGPQE